MSVDHEFKTRLDVSRLSILSHLEATIIVQVDIDLDNMWAGEWRILSAHDSRGREIDKEALMNDAEIESELDSEVQEEMSDYDWQELEYELASEDDAFGMPFDMSVNSF